MISCTQSVPDFDLYCTASINDDRETMKKIKRKHQISDWYPESVVMSGLYANLMGRDIHREMNDIMDSREED